MTKARGQVSFSIADKGDDSYFISLNPSPLVMSDKNDASIGGSAWYSEYKSEIFIRLGEVRISRTLKGTAPSSYSGGQPVWPATYPIHVEVGEVKNMDGTTNSDIVFAYEHQTISYDGDIHLLVPMHKHFLKITTFNDLDVYEGYVDVKITIVDAPEELTPGHVETELYHETVRLNFSLIKNSRDSIDDYGITDAAFGTPGAESIPITLGNTTKDVLTTQARQANKILAGPASGNSAAPTFRSLVVADIPLDDRLSYVDPNAGETVIIEDTGTTGTVLWGAESATQVALDVNGTSKLLVKYAAIEGINSSIGTILSYFTSGAANNALRLGGQLPSYYATAAGLSALSSVVDTKLSVAVTSLGGATGAITLGAGLTMSGNELSVTGQTIGTVTSVAMSVPTGFSVSGSPITSSGTLALSFASGYSLPSDTTQASWTAKYDKPSGGIPKDDLASAVKTSLGLADSALQSHQTITLASGTNNGTLKITTAAGTTDNVAVTGLGTAAYRGIATAIGASITNLVTGALLYSVLGDAFDSTNTVKAFVNSSIATATATYRGSYNVVSDLSLAYNATHAQIEAALGTAITTADDNDYAFVEIPVSGESGAPIGKTERYKYNGTSWSYEYALNNSGFTAAQWSAINSGITSSLVDKLNGIASGAQVNVIESVKVNGTALTVSSKAVDITAVPLSIITGAEDLQAIEALTGTTGLLKKTAANTWALDTTAYITAASLPLVFGTGTNSAKGLDSHVFASGNYSFAHGFVVDGDGNVSASGVASVALGYATMYSEIKGTSIAAFAQGYANDDATIQATNTGAFARGYASDSALISASASGALASGYAEEGGSITASGSGAIAFGYAVNDGSITASGYGSLAFGFVNDDSITAPGSGALAFGRACSALGDYALVHGMGCSAIGDKSTAQGGTCTAHGDSSFASGSNVYAMNDYEQAFGMYNYYREGNTNADTTIFSVGVGTASNARKNAIEIMRDGKVYLLGSGGYNGSSLSSVTDIGTLIGGMVLIGNSASYDTTDLIVVN